jgi:hypothetical protein
VAVKQLLYTHARSTRVESRDFSLMTGLNFDLFNVGEKAPFQESSLGSRANVASTWVSAHLRLLITETSEVSADRSEGVSRNRRSFPHEKLNFNLLRCGRDERRNPLIRRLRGALQIAANYAGQTALFQLYFYRKLTRDEWEKSKLKNSILWIFYARYKSETDAPSAAR